MTHRVADRYELAEQIGSGGSARVFAAVDERLGRRVAVKVLDAKLARSADPGSRERFLREGPTSASFMHRNAVAVFDAGQDDDDLYIVMELVDGPSLADVLAERGPLPVAEATHIAAQVLSALAAAHEAGIVHRDVKPGNILLASSGDAKLTDFGIAKRFDDLDESVTQAGTTIGTPRYLTPEQAAGGPLSPASDVYAMGIVLFEMLTGRTPFRGDSPVAVALAQRMQPAPDVRELRPDVPPALAGVVARALSRLPADRFSTAAEMGAALGSTWSPPPAPLPESAIPTTLIEAPLGPRSGHTAVMASAAAPAGTVERPPLASPSRWRWMISVVAIVLVVLALAAIVRSSAERSSAASTSTTLPASTSTVATTAPPSTPTSAPATAVPTVAEIIPGFPFTADLATFLRQLESDPSLVGPAGAEVASQLDRLLDENSTRKRRDRAKELTSRVGKWADEGQLDPAIAQALADLLAPLAAKAKG